VPPAARLGASIGRYWSKHFKTEIEVMTSTEGMHYAARLATAADGSTWPYGVQEYYRLSQGSARAATERMSARPWRSVSPPARAWGFLGLCAIALKLD